MISFFLNPWMLAGLAGILLPVIAHLLSRKKYDFVEWGAMQFLQVDPSAKRQFQLDELLLLLVRMGLVALFAIALARPWVQSRGLAGIVSSEPRDVVLIIDQSYSMDRDLSGTGKTPRSQAIQLAREFLAGLRTGDLVQLIDAREQPNVLLSNATRDLYAAKEVLNSITPPSGTADLVAAIKKGIQLLAASARLRREIVIFTDLQALSWKCDDTALWSRIDDLRQQSSVVPRVWVIDASDGVTNPVTNFALDRLQLSREMSIVGGPVTISSKVTYSGGVGPVSRKVHLEIDQFRLPDQTVLIKLQPEGETTVHFEHQFDSPGTHAISLILDSDALPGDNRTDAVISVLDSIPILLVDGDQQPDPTRSETYFARAAMQATGDEHPWIKPSVISPEELNIERLRPVSFVVIANVGRLSDEMISVLRQFAASGHGVLFTLGDKVDREHYRTSLFEGGEGLIPARLESEATENDAEKRGVRILSNQLELAWLKPFRADQGGAIDEARWSRWWKVTVPHEIALPRQTPTLDAAGSEQRFTDDRESVGTPVTEIELTTHDPLLVTRRFGRGATALLTSSLDADWNTFPAKLDYVPFLHELILSLIADASSRNVNVGTPLILNVPTELKSQDYQFLDPAKKPIPFDRLEDPFQATIRVGSTLVPGIYRFVRKVPAPLDHHPTEFFAVEFDRRESDLTPLSQEQRNLLSSSDRMTFVSSLPDLRQNMFSDSPRSEVWWLILYFFVAMMAVETWLTRRMVQGGLLN